MSKVFPLKGNQRLAVDPADTVWLSASAGTGKTQVLSARVLRLLLQPGVSPSQLLCLTFTKAGAAEMAVRVNEVLANWVRMPDMKLFEELRNIGAPDDPASRDRARTLFASVLDCPGGGLRIDTIHAFSQWLLAGFPEEAGLSPGTRPMEDRDRILLLRDVLGTLLVEAEARGDHAFMTALSTLAVRMKDSGEVEHFLLRCASARSAWFGPGSWELGDLRPRIMRLLGLPEDAGEDSLVALCSDDEFECDALELCLSAYKQWNGKKGMAGREVIAAWLAADPADRLESFAQLFAVLFTQKDTIKDVPSLEKFEAHFGDAAERVLEAMLRVRDMRGLLSAADYIVPALTLGRAFAHAWDEAKKREGLIDFDDQIRQAAELLGRSDVADWIRYKLDRQFDHVLIDEAQDTNAAQWEIINALTGDFFSGEGQHGERLRTLFVVGDYKQAIFRFQGTSPENFEQARQRVKGELDRYSANISALRSNLRDRRLQELWLGTSFRTAWPVMEFVDKAIGAIGFESFGLSDPPDAHKGETRPGQVVLWDVV
ncbi:MAG: UvrD-helicase domain-containing protein, partial [Novosphingobium sp.]